MMRSWDIIKAVIMVTSLRVLRRHCSVANICLSSVRFYCSAFWTFDMELQTGGGILSIHKYHDRDSNPHSAADNPSAWVR